MPGDGCRRWAAAPAPAPLRSTQPPRPAPACLPSRQSMTHSDEYKPMGMSATQVAGGKGWGRAHRRRSHAHAPALHSAGDPYTLLRPRPRPRRTSPCSTWTTRPLCASTRARRVRPTGCGRCGGHRLCACGGPRLLRGACVTPAACAASFLPSLLPSHAPSDPCKHPPPRPLRPRLLPHVQLCRLRRHRRAAPRPLHRGLLPLLVAARSRLHL